MSRIPGATLVVAALLSMPFAASADKVRVANEGGIRGAWMLAPGASLPAPGYPGEFAGRADDVCVAMGYRINPDGSTSDFSLLRAWSSAGDDEPVEGYWDAFSKASAAALQQWRFTPRPDVKTPRPVDTVATMTFTGKQVVAPAELRAKCRIGDLDAFLEQVKVDMSKRSDMNRHQLDRTYQQQRRNEMIRTPRS